MNLKKLCEPFPAEDIEWRIGRAGEKNGKVWATCLAYITARAVCQRLDDVCGAENWSVSYEHRTGGVMCKLGIRAGDQMIFTFKEDGAEQSDIDPFKGGISGALKRAAATWGVGRYLYSLTEGFAQIVDSNTKGAHYGKTKDTDKAKGIPFYWLPPELPEWALPPVETKPGQVQLISTAIKDFGDHVIAYGVLKNKKVKELTKEQATTYCEKVRAVIAKGPIDQVIMDDFDSIKRFWRL